MLDTINTDATQDNARALDGLFAGKQIMDARDRDGLHARNTVAFTDENGDMQEHDICAFDHYGNATTVNVDETANGN